MLHALTPLAFGLHIGGGAVGLVSGMVAGFSRKGGRIHRAAGNVFFVSMLVMATFAIWLGFAMPGQLVNVVIGLFAGYLVATGWMTVRRGERGWPEITALVVALVLCAPFAILSFQLAAGLPPMIHSATPLEGPVKIAVFVITTVIAIAALSDLKVAIAGGIAGAPRIARHLWRMCLGLGLATGSAFTNGFSRLAPHAWHVPFGLYFLPQFIPLGLLVFWMIRVRIGGWAERAIG